MRRTPLERYALVNITENLFPPRRRPARICGNWRQQIFLPDRDFSLQAVEKLTEQAPTPAFRALLERFISERWLPAAASEVNEAVSNLFMMWVGPYLWMEERPK